MPRIRRRGVPRPLLKHLWLRVDERQVSILQLELFATWLETAGRQPLVKPNRRNTHVSISRPVNLRLHFRGYVALGFLLSSLLVWAEPAELPPLWKLVAQSHTIIVGIPTLPVDQLEESEGSGDSRYIEIDTRVQQCLKGDPCPATIAVRYFTKPASYSVATHALVSANEKESVFFLLTNDELGTSKTYFAGYTPAALQASKPELISEIRAEVAAQAEILSHFANNFPSTSEPLYGNVKTLVDATLSRWKETRAFADLERLGRAAVPAMIMLMDDRRELPLKEMSLRNSPGAFEVSRHYGPKVVCDAIAAILSQITDEQFGFIYNGDSERERRAAIDGWRIYLHHTKFGGQGPTEHVR